MSAVALHARGTTAAITIADAPAWWETATVLTTLALASNAVVPLVFNPGTSAVNATSSLTAAPVVVYDPISQPSWLLLTLFILAMVIRHGREILVALLRNPGIVVVCYLALISMFWSSVPGLTLQYGVQLGFSTVFAVYVGVRFGIARFVRVISWMTLGAIVLSMFFALVLKRYGIDPAHNGSWRGVFGTKNELGRMAVFGGTAWAVRLVMKDVSHRRGLLALALFAAAGIGSGSRTALGVSGLMIVAMSLAALFVHTEPAWVAVKGLVLSAIALIAVALATSLTLLLHVVGSDYTLTGRIGIWGAVIDAIRVHPWLGYGFGAFWRGIYGPSLAVFRQAQTNPPHSHNGFLDLLLNLGVAGLLALLVAYGTALGRAVKQLQRGTGSARLYPFVFLCLFLLYNLTESSLVDRRSLEWIVFVAVAAGLVRESPGWEVHRS
jgi:O-antigen ligase